MALECLEAGVNMAFIKSPIKKRFGLSGISRDPLFVSIHNCWAVLVGMGLVMIGNGLQSALLGVRASLEGFSASTTGIIMSGYFAGFIASSQLTPHLVRRVGHIRVFASMASLVSIAVLLHIFYIDPVLWTGMRALTGFSLAGLYIVAESWLNGSISNKNRGQLLSVYMVVTMGGVGLGPFLLNVADPKGFELFVLVSIVFSFALLPILLTVRPTPRVDAPAWLSLKGLVDKVPLGVVSCWVTGISNGTVISVSAVYAQISGFSLLQTAFFLGLMQWGAVACQWPIGYLSDKLDRRVVMATVTLLAAGMCVAAAFADFLPTIGFWILVGLFGGLSFPMYALSLSYTNDYLTTDQMVQASSSLLLVYSLGAIAGPIATGISMDWFGAPSFWVILALVHAGLGGYVVFRIRAYTGVPLEEQGPPVYLARTSSVAAAAAFDYDEKENDR
jgi:MFS family permease